VLRALRDYLRFGGFPEVVLSEEEADKLNTLGGYMELISCGTSWSATASRTRPP